jgi:hypothetical protein
LLVLLTQRLTLRHTLHARPTLSALHDTTGAWLGPGAAATALLAQLRVRTAPRRVTLVAAYLGGVLVLHITTPALFGVVPYEVVGKVRVPTLLGRVVPVEVNNDVVYIEEAHLYAPFPYSLLAATTC